MTRTDNHGSGPDDELLCAFMDGELDADRAEDLRRRLAREPELARRLEALRNVDARLRDAFAASGEEPLPERLRELVTAAPGQADVVKRQARVFALPPFVALSRRWLPLAAAASVALVAGVLIGRDSLPTGAGELALLAGQPRLAADSALHDVVAHAPSGQSRTLPDGRVVTPEYTFRTPEGSVCRRLAVTGNDGVTAAVTCRENGVWGMRLVGFAAPAETTGYTPAFGRPDPFERAVEAMMAGAPLDAATERTALAGD